jgi:hypothetical protein
MSRKSPTGTGRAALALVAAWAVWACACKDEQAPQVDAGQPDDAPLACRAATVCDGTRVIECSDGGPTGVVTECGPDQVCSLGRCTSRSCQAEEQKPSLSLIGCAFYTLEVDNVTSESAATSSVLVANPGDTAATVQLLQRNPIDHAWRPIALQAVAPGGAARIALPMSHSTGEGGLGVGVALQLTSNAPITAAHIQSDDSTESAMSTGGTLLLPVRVLGFHYMAVTYPQLPTPKLIQTPGGRRGAGQVIIVGTVDDTTVTFTASGTSHLDEASGTPKLGPGEAFKLTLNDGDIYQIFSDLDGDDLTGSTIDADQPVAVFSGNMSTTYGGSHTGINSPDMAHEQLLPVPLWGTDYVATLLPPQVGDCEGVLGLPDAGIFRLVAIEDDTEIHIDAPAGVIYLDMTAGPTTLTGSIMLLGAGEARSLVVAGGSFRATSNKRFLITQGMDCEPTIASAVPTKSMLTDLRFAVLPQFDQMIAVVRHTGVSVMLDEAPIDGSLFNPAGGDFEVALVPLSGCQPSAGACAHHLAGQFGMAVRGMDVLSSYEWTAPTWVCDIDTPGCVD